MSYYCYYRCHYVYHYYYYVLPKSFEYIFLFDCTLVGITVAVAHLDYYTATSFYQTVQLYHFCDLNNVLIIWSLCAGRDLACGLLPAPHCLSIDKMLLNVAQNIKLEKSQGEKISVDVR